MSNKHRKFIFLFIAILLSLLLFLMFNKYKTYNLLDYVENDRIEDLTLTISYIEPSMLTPFPLQPYNLLEEYCDKRIVVSGRELCGVKDELYTIGEYIPEIVQKTSKGMDARIHYTIKNKLGINLLEVVAWSFDGNIYVNDIEIRDNEIYYKLLLPFVDEDMGKYLNTHINNLVN